MTAENPAKESDQAPLIVEPIPELLPRAETMDGDRLTGLGAAATLHGLVLLVLLLGLRTPVEPPEPPNIPVELVNLPPPPSPAAAPGTPQPPSKEQAVRESGGDPNLKSGKPPDAEAPKTPEPAPEETKSSSEAAKPPEPQQPSEPAPPSTDEAPASQEAKKSTAVTVVPPQPPPLKEQRQPTRMAALAPKQPPAASENESRWIGQGGGDRYLNALRDDILRNRNYPAAIRSLGLNGTAQYEILLDREGRLLDLKLVHSSGVDVLDHAGLVMIQHTAPFPPLPEDIVGQAVHLVVTLHMAP